MRRPVTVAEWAERRGYAADDPFAGLPREANALAVLGWAIANDPSIQGAKA